MASFDELRAESKLPEGKSLIAAAEGAASTWRAADHHLIELLKSGKADEAIACHQQTVVPSFNELSGSIENCINYRKGNLERFNKQAQDLISTISLILLGFAIASASVAGVFGSRFTRGIAIPLSASVKHLAEVARGDLTKDVPQQSLTRKDEIGQLSQAAQGMTASLRDVLKNISVEIDVLTAAAQKLTTESSHMSHGSRHVSEQAHSVAAASEEVGVNVASVAASGFCCRGQ